MNEEPEEREIIPSLEETPREEILTAEQEAAAAEEAGAVGGRDPHPGADPAQAPLEEAGQGESEGFEQAEAALIRQASHEDAPSSPTQDAFAPERESDASTAEYGESDEEELPDS